LLSTQAIRTTKTPKPRAAAQRVIFSPISTSEFPAPVEAGVGDDVGDGVEEGLAVGLPEPELFDPVAALELEDRTEGIEVDADPESVEEVFGGEVVELETILELEEPEPEDPAATTTPPCALPADEEEEVPAAAALYAARVLPVEGPLTTPTMPPWQWVGVAQKK
jgi:hypothetical protein